MPKQIKLSGCDDRKNRGAPMITGETVGKLNIQRFFETLARVVSEDKNLVITVKSIRLKESETKIFPPSTNNAESVNAPREPI